MTVAARVLLVDDEEELRELISFELRDEGFDVTEAGCGSEAIEVLKDTDPAQPFDFVISDIRMPKGDGVSLLKWIVENISPKPFVFLMTGFAEVTRDEIIALGAQELFEKPFAVRKLLQELLVRLDRPKT